MNGEIIVDSFAGGGGASTGIEMALGRSPDFAINHDPEALALHAANHPDTVHLSKNIYNVDPINVVGRHKVGLLWASPDCKHFSKAKGGKPVKREIRDLAWVVVQWAERVRPRVIILENVEEFQTWGPLVETKPGIFMPHPERMGETFNEWVGALRRLGYKVEWRELRACDYGAPTTRKRLFLIARCDGQPIVWPVATHGAPESPEVRTGLKQPWVTAAETIDWSEPCPSIFDTSEQIMAEYGIRAIRPLAENTLARIAKGVKRYVLDAALPFIVNLTHGVRTEPANEPFKTVTGAHRGEKGVIVPHVTKFQSGAVGSDIGAPLPTVTANSFIKKPGGAAPIGIVAAHISAAQQGGSIRSAGEPLHTVTASPKDQNQVIAASIVGLAHGESGGRREYSAEEPLTTIHAGGNNHALMAASLVQTGYGEREGQKPRALDPGAPLGTVVAGGVKHAAIAAHLQRQFGASVGHGADEPNGSITAGGGGKSAVVAAFLAQHNTDVVGHSAHEPVSTIVQKGCTQAVVSAGLMNMKGSERRMSDVESPAPAVTSQGNHIAEVRAFLMKYYGVDQDPRLDAPLSTVTTKDRFGLVMVNGEPYQITDIGMRMLTPRELFKAQGFPAGYEIETGVFEGGERRRLTKTSQVRMCGNSVCPPIAAALVRANCADLAVMREAAE